MSSNSTTPTDLGLATTAEPAAARKHRGRGERGPLASAGLHTVLGVAAFIATFPVAWVVYISLGAGEFDYEHPQRIASHLSLANYSHVLAQTDFLTWLRNSAIVSAGTMVVGVLVSASAGYAVSRIRFLGRGTLMYSFLLTQMFPVAVLMVPLYRILSQTGLLDSYQGLILVYCTTAVPYCAWLLKGYFDTIPVEIDEAGRIDGLSPFGTFWRLILPLARPGLAVAAFYTFITAWGEVAFASFFLLSPNKLTLAIGMKQFISQYNSQWNYLAATGVLIAVPAAVVFYLVQKNLVTGLTSGGTKG
jgi:arabinogalactan oligomer/maltooligosaccharide transport system permease protein